MSRFGEAVADLTIGLGSLAYATTGTSDSKSKADFLEFGSHFLNRAVTTRPEDITQMLQELQSLRIGISNGNLQAVRSAFIRTPEDIVALMRALQLASKNLMAADQGQAPSPPVPPSGNQSSPGHASNPQPSPTPSSASSPQYVRDGVPNQIGPGAAGTGTGITQGFIGPTVFY